MRQPVRIPSVGRTVIRVHRELNSAVSEALGATEDDAESQQQHSVAVRASHLWEQYVALGRVEKRKLPESSKTKASRQKKRQVLPTTEKVTSAT